MMLETLARVEKIAPTDAFVLLQGESGTGKTQLGRMIHRLSKRADRPFVEVNCAAIPESLIESELFGHVKGAFTGANQDRPGRFKSADKGTLFLDEISELPIHLQPKLLRAIQDQRFEMVGSDKPMRVDVRIISASNRDLRQLVDEGAFRADLYYRLAVIPLHLPPLRERIGDLPLLIRHFIELLHARGYRHGVQISAAAMRMLMDYPWPGNVRELENAIEHGLICAIDNSITEDSLPQDIRHYARFEPSASHGHLSEQEKHQRTALVEALRKARGSRTVAASLLGIDRTTLWRRMRKYALR